MGVLLISEGNVWVIWKQRIQEIENEKWKTKQNKNKTEEEKL